MGRSPQGTRNESSQVGLLLIELMQLPHHAIVARDYKLWTRRSDCLLQCFKGFGPAIEVITPHTRYVMQRMPRWTESFHTAIKLQERTSEPRGEWPPSRCHK